MARLRPYGLSRARFCLRCAENLDRRSSSSLEALAVLRGLGRGACGNVQRSEDSLPAGELPVMTCPPLGLPMNRRRTFRLSKSPQSYAKTRSTPTMVFKSLVVGAAFASAFLAM